MRQEKILEKEIVKIVEEEEEQRDKMWNICWSRSLTWVRSLIRSELLKRGEGYRTADIVLPLWWMEKLNIHSSFKFQDPYGLSADGSGEVERYYYVEDLQYDIRAKKLRVKAVDLQYLLRQYLLLGDETVLTGAEANYNTASDASKMWAFLCDEVSEKFQNGDPGKILANEILGL